MPSIWREWGKSSQNIIEKVNNKARPEQWQSLVVPGKMGTPAVEYLVLALKDEDKRVRHAVAVVPGNIGDRCSVDPLIVSLLDHDQDVRFLTAEALG